MLDQIIRNMRFYYERPIELAPRRSGIKKSRISGDILAGIDSEHCRFVDDLVKACVAQNILLVLVDTHKRKKVDEWLRDDPTGKTLSWFLRPPFLRNDFTFGGTQPSNEYYYFVDRRYSADGTPYSGHGDYPELDEKWYIPLFFPNENERVVFSLWLKGIADDER